MRLVITTNAATVSKALQADNDELIADFERGFAEASQAIADDFRRNQLSGRTSGDIGLNIKSGDLRRSIRGDGMRDGNDILGVVSNSNATYWEYHQDGTARLKKRLFFHESFANDGPKRYTSVVELAFARLSR